MTEHSILVDQIGAVAVITLNRPEAFNALTLRDWERLLDALIECGEDREVRAVVLTGAGQAFCAGADIREMEASSSRGKAAAFLKKITVVVHGDVATMAWMPKPVIAEVNGTAAGAGFSLALATDIILASEKAAFSLAYTRIGLSPDGSSTFFLPRLVGMKRALDLIYSNRTLTAAQARELGVVTETFPDPEFQPEIRDFAARLAVGPTQALARAKRLLSLGAGATLETQMEHERAAIAESAATGDFQEGIRAFLEKRAPKFAGQ
jgi:2-(1,2-epoxy-1,2-dihydrophenyl)acetyl-CoA isomerase